jgi:N-acyl-D-amino-acid deacylase
VCHYVRDRGRLEPGAVADVVVFNPATIADTATFTEPTDIPAGFPGCSSTASP